MLIEFDNVKKYGITPRGVIHVGMHKAEEYPIYKQSGVETIIFVEANEQLAHQYAPDDEFCYTVHAAVSDVEEEIEFNITNNGESSSILDLGDHASIYPHIYCVGKVKMRTTTLTRILQKVGVYHFAFNILNLDIQGAELKAMKGLRGWDHIQAVFTEVNYREMYKGCALVGEVDDYLSSLGFRKVEEVDTGAGWGDALYIKNESI